MDLNMFNNFEQYPDTRGEKGLEDINNTVDLTNKLNEDCLLNLFTFLPRNDIVTVQRVCHSWRASAQHKSLWNNYTLTLTNTPADEKNIILMPALRNIDGKTENRMLDVILSNVTELKKLNCELEPAISSTQAQDVLQKYPELESITVNKYSPDILETINKLKSACNLKEVDFVGEFGYDLLLHKSNTVLIFECLSDPANFPALTNLNLSKFADDIDTNSKLRNIVADVIQKRSGQLLYLKYRYSNYDITDPILNSINYCTKLKVLRLFMFRDHPESFNLDNLSQLETLQIYTAIGRNFKFPKMVKEVFIRKTWEHLLELHFCLESLQVLNILQLIIENSKHLRILKYNESLYTLNESQLERISHLTKLEELEVGSFKTMTQKSLDYLSGCHNLTYLYIRMESSNIEDLHFRLATMIRPMTKLTSLKMCMTSCAVKNVNLHNRGEIDELLQSNYNAEMDMQQ